MCCISSYWIYNLWPISCDLGSIFLHSIFVENTELHIGPRPKNSIYSGGQTAWQDPEEKKKFKPIIPKTLVRLDTKKITGN
jgi:hypothetical protein